MSVKREVSAWIIGRSIVGGMVLGGAAFVGALALAPETASAQGFERIVDGGAVSPPGGLPMGSMLPPREIIAAVRSAGFDPLSRPVARGGVYVLFAINRYYMDVQVRVDGRSGRVLSVTRLAGAAYGGPIYEGHLPAMLQRSYPPAYAPPSPNYERPPVPPANVPLAPPARNFGAAPPSRSGAPDTVAKKSASAPAPVSRVRHEDNPPSAAPDFSAADQSGSSAAPPPPPAAASPAPPPSGMVPIAPLE